MQPKRPRTHASGLSPVQLPLFADTACLIRIRPALNEWRFYRMEVQPDLFGRALLMRQWGGSAPRAYAGSIHIQTPAPAINALA